MIDSNQDEAVKLEGRHHLAHMSHCNEGEYIGSCAYGEDEACPALTRAPDKQEALVGEGVEDMDHDDYPAEFRAWIRRLDEDVIQGEYGYEDGEFGIFPDDWRPLWEEGLTPEQAFQRALDGHRAARTLPSNEALAGDDRNGVEGPSAAEIEEALDRMFGELSWDAGYEEAFVAGWKLALSRTPSSPQADVERVARIIDPTAFDNSAGADSYHARIILPARRAEAIEKARAIATMTTRPAGGEEVEKAARNSGLIEAALECERQAKEMTFSSEMPEAEQQCARRTASMMATMIQLLLTHDHLGQWHGFEQLAALTKPAALPKEGGEVEEDAPSGAVTHAKRNPALSSLPVRSGEGVERAFSAGHEAGWLAATDHDPSLRSQDERASTQRKTLREQIADR